jgi:hypothetical protein
MARTERDVGFAQCESSDDEDGDQNIGVRLYQFEPYAQQINPDLESEEELQEEEEEDRLHSLMW